jgi:hypothetical protein
MDETFITMNAELTDTEAMALAQFVKRVGWQEIRSCAVSNNEAYFIRDAIGKVQTNLKELGYAPR